MTHGKVLLPTNAAVSDLGELGVSEEDSAIMELSGMKSLTLQSTTSVSANETSGSDSWESLQKRGNDHFRAGKYELAIAAYSDAIELKRKVAPEKDLADLLANRAAAYFADEKPIDAFWDCQSALFVQPGHLKATFRLAKAQASLGKYVEARDVLTNHPDTNTPAFQTETCRLRHLIREQKFGDYDLKSMLKEAAASKTPRLDHADYNGGVEVQCISEEKGNGLVALRDFAPGDLLFASKAFEATYRWECKLDVDKTARPDASQRECTFRIIRRISKNTDLAKELYRLDAGPHFERFSSDDSVFTLDLNRAATIVARHSIGLKDADADTTVPKELRCFESVHFGFRFVGCGVWLLESFMNHACMPNTMTFFVGDFIFVRAMTAIRKGEELTLSRAANSDDYEKRREVIGRKLPGFQCECELCVCDMKRAAEQPHLEVERNAFSDSYVTIMQRSGKNKTKSVATVAEEIRKSAEEFLRRLAYKNRYDPHLQSIYASLGGVYNATREWLLAAKAFEVAYAGTVGKGVNVESTFRHNAMIRMAVFFCFNVAHNYLFGRDFAKAKEFLGKMQAAAKVAWGKSADEELLAILYPDLPIKEVFQLLA